MAAFVTQHVGMLICIEQDIQMVSIMMKCIRKKCNPFGNMKLASTFYPLSSCLWTDISLLPGHLGAYSQDRGSCKYFLIDVTLTVLLVY